MAPKFPFALAARMLTVQSLQCLRATSRVRTSAFCLSRPAFHTRRTQALDCSSQALLTLSARSSV